MRVQPLCLPLDAEVLELLPVAVEIFAAYIQHRLRSRLRPAHARPLHAILDVMPARPLDDPRSDRVALPQVLVITHSVLVGLQVVTDRPQLLLLRSAQGPQRPQSSQSPHPPAPPRPPAPPPPPFPCPGSARGTPAPRNGWAAPLPSV